MKQNDEMSKRIVLKVSLEKHNKYWYAYKKSKSDGLIPKDKTFANYILDLIEKEINEKYPF